jgi:hypothetical protein
LISGSYVIVVKKDSDGLRMRREELNGDSDEGMEEDELRGGN